VKNRVTELLRPLKEEEVDKGVELIIRRDCGDAEARRLCLLGGWESVNRLAARPMQAEKFSTDLMIRMIGMKGKRSQFVWGLQSVEDSDPLSKVSQHGLGDFGGGP